jgi:hypothetical protein
MSHGSLDSLATLHILASNLEVRLEFERRLWLEATSFSHDLNGQWTVWEMNKLRKGSARRDSSHAPLASHTATKEEKERDGH